MSRRICRGCAETQTPPERGRRNAAAFSENPAGGCVERCGEDSVAPDGRCGLPEFRVSVSRWSGALHPQLLGFRFDPAGSGQLRSRWERRDAEGDMDVADGRWRGSGGRGGERAWKARETSCEKT